MKPFVISQTGVGDTAAVPINVNVNPVNIGLAVVVDGTVNYTVQYTFDDVWSTAYNPATGTWFDHAALAAQTGSLSGNFAFPVSGIRLAVNSGSGTAVMTVIQAGVA